MSPDCTPCLRHFFTSIVDVNRLFAHDSDMTVKLLVMTSYVLSWELHLNAQVLKATATVWPMYVR